MRGIILAAGRGTRMETMTSNQPKCLTELQGKALVDWQLDAMKTAGITKISIVVGYLGHTIANKAEHHFENPRWADTQMVASLCAARPWLQKQPCLVSYSDIIYDAKTVKTLVTCEHDIAITYHTRWLELWEARFEDPLDDAESFRLNDQGQLLEIGGKAHNVRDIQGQYMGLLKFTPQGWTKVEGVLKTLAPEVLDKLDMTSLLNLLLKVGIDIHTEAVDGLWYEVDTKSDWELYRKWLQKRPYHAND
jgi:L-glutamine-phosphate cytidylyltransferase